MANKLIRNFKSWPANLAVPADGALIFYDPQTDEEYQFLPKQLPGTVSGAFVVTALLPARQLVAQQRVQEQTLYLISAGDTLTSQDVLVVGLSPTGFSPTGYLVVPPLTAGAPETYVAGFYELATGRFTEGSGGAPAAVTYAADVNIAVGTLVGRTATGIVPYDAASLSARHTLLGVALQSASAGGRVKVQNEPGLVVIPGWGLTSGTVYRAGANGVLLPAPTGVAFTQIIGRAASADGLIFSPNPLITL